MLQFFDATNVYQVDSYSMLIVSKYFKTTQDFINVICVCKKFKETTEKLRFNPIPIKSLKLFPKIQTQYLYSKHDVMLKGVENFEAYYVIDYKQYLKLKGNNINFHHIKYTKYNRMSYGLEIPINVKELGESCYSCCNCITFTIPTQITSIELDCFSYNTKLINITLPKYLTKISNNCFSNCYSLTSITIPLSIESIHNYSFNECINLQSINLPNSITSIGNYCFFKCTSLKSITLPSSLIILENSVFNCCYSLTKIKFPTSLTTIGERCFCNCTSISILTLPSSIKQIGKNCYFGCNNLTSINYVPELTI